MVKNESAIITRLLDSVRPSVQGVFVCDTGSTDSTVDVANEWIKKAELPGMVVTYPFTTFGESRTESFELCQAWVAENGWDAAETWCLVLDGDMVLDGVLQPFTVSRDVAGLSLKQQNGSLLYSNIRLMRASEPWVCQGATHEVWVCPPGRTEALAAPVIQDLNDGGSRADKFERDLRLLLRDLLKSPNDSRTLFYLGQTYKCLDQHNDAREVLKRRIEVGGWDEETYMARIYLGDCSEEDAVSEWLTAWESRPARTEAPLRLIAHYRKKPSSQFIAGMFLEKLFLTQFGEELGSGERVGTPLKTKDTLFVDTRGLSVGIWVELGILGFYIDRKKQTLIRLDEYDLTSRDWRGCNEVLANLHWYMPIASARVVRLELPISSLPWADEEEAYIWMPFNPSLCLDNGYVVNLRYANYSTTNATSTVYRGSSGKIITRNCQVRYTKEWIPESVSEVKIQGVERKESAILGLEDCRFVRPGVLLGTSVSYSNGINQMFMISESESWTVRAMPLPAGVSENLCQKNWLGFMVGEDFFYIYGWNPYTVCRQDGSVVLKDDAGVYSLADYRGSAAPVPWTSEAYPREAYLCAIHKVQSSDGRRYYQRLVTLDSDLRISRISCFLRMTTKKIEYWSGLCPSVDGSYWVSYGIEDSQAWVAEIRRPEIESWLWYDRNGGIPFSSRMTRIPS